MTVLNDQTRHCLLKTIRFLCDARRVSLILAGQDLHGKLQRLLSQKALSGYLRL